MTISDAKNLLFDHFARQDYFDIEKNFSDIILLPENEALEKEIILTAIKDLEKQNLVAAVILETKTIYVLTKLLQQYNQNVELGFASIAGITKTINKHCEDAGEPYRVDSLAISEKDILILLHLVGQNEK